MRLDIWLIVRPILGPILFLVLLNLSEPIILAFYFFQLLISNVSNF